MSNGPVWSGSMLTCNATQSITQASSGPSCFHCPSPHLMASVIGPLHSCKAPPRSQRSLPRLVPPFKSAAAMAFGDETRGSSKETWSLSWLLFPLQTCDTTLPYNPFYYVTCLPWLPRTSIFPHYWPVRQEHWVKPRFVCLRPFATPRRHTLFIFCPFWIQLRANSVLFPVFSHRPNLDSALLSPEHEILTRWLTARFSPITSSPFTTMSPCESSTSRTGPTRVQ